MALALELTLWSRDVLLCTDGQPGLSSDDRTRLSGHGVWLREERVVGLVGDDEGLDHVRFASGGIVPRRAVFLATEQHQRSGLAASLGFELTEHGILTSEYEAAHVPGLYVAGDATRGVELSVVAAAEGALAALAIHTALLREDLPGWLEHRCCGRAIATTTRAEANHAPAPDDTEAERHRPVP